MLDVNSVLELMNSNFADTQVQYKGQKIPQKKGSSHANHNVQGWLQQTAKLNISFPDERNISSKVGN